MVRRMFGDVPSTLSLLFSARSASSRSNPRVARSAAPPSPPLGLCPGLSPSRAKSSSTTRSPPRAAIAIARRASASTRASTESAAPASSEAAASLGPSPLRVPRFGVQVYERLDDVAHHRRAVGRLPRERPKRQARVRGGARERPAKAHERREDGDEPREERLADLRRRAQDDRIPPAASVLRALRPSSPRVRRRVDGGRLRRLRPPRDGTRRRRVVHAGGRRYRPRRRPCDRLRLRLRRPPRRPWRSRKGASRRAAVVALGDRDRCSGRLRRACRAAIAAALCFASPFSAAVIRGAPRRTARPRAPGAPRFRQSREPAAASRWHTTTSEDTRRGRLLAALRRAAATGSGRRRRRRRRGCRRSSGCRRCRWSRPHAEGPGGRGRIRRLAPRRRRTTPSPPRELRRRDGDGDAPRSSSRALRHPPLRRRHADRASTAPPLRRVAEASARLNLQAPSRRRRRLRRPRRDEGVRSFDSGRASSSRPRSSRAVAQDDEERGQDAGLDERVVRLEEAERGQRAGLVLEADVLDTAWMSRRSWCPRGSR